MQILKTWTFKWWEIGLLKICLISLGILLGLYFYDYLVSLLGLWWILFLVTAIYFIARFLKGK
jgi:small multidrug resistance family-3 protein